jgi:hypothetical protein
MKIFFLGDDKKHTVNGCSVTIVSTNKSKVDILGNSHLNRSVPRIGTYLTLCRSNLNPYCMGRKAAFFSVGI